MKEDGITLIELIIVITIIGILAIALGFSFQGWIGGYRVESQVKEMYADLMNARARAMERNRVHCVTLAVNQYKIIEDRDPWPDGNGDCNDAEDKVVLQKDLDTNYPITWNGADSKKFNTRGLANVGSTICSYTTIDADYNCIVISATRINLGKLTTKIPAPYNGTCDETNCVVK